MGVVCAAANEGNPNPKIPANGAFKKAFPSSWTTAPNTYSSISNSPILIVSLTNSPLISPVP